MGTLVFTDEQIRTITEQVLSLPITLDGIPELGVTGLRDSLVTAQEEKENFLSQDEDKKIFFDNVLLSVQKYHEEILQIVGDSRTLYSEADLIASAKHTLPHYEKTTWFNAVIEIIASNNGNPRTTNSQEAEDDKIQDVIDAVDGYILGTPPSSPLNSTLSQPYNPGDGFVHTENTGGSVGDIILIENTFLSQIMVAIITNVTGPDGTCTNAAFNNDPAGCALDNFTNEYETLGAQKIFFDVIDNDQNFSDTATITNVYDPFTNSERGRQEVIAPERQVIQTALEDNIVTFLAIWESELQATKAIIESQVTSGDNTKIAENQVALDNVQNILDDITTWENTPLTSATGRYTDSSVVPLIKNNTILRKDTQIPNRNTEISTFLGSVAQDAQGNVSGDGQYFELTNIIKSRIDLIGGSLSSFFQADLTLVSIDQDIKQKESDLARYEANFDVKPLLEESELGQIEFEVEDASSFSPADEVKVFDNSSLVFTRNIDTIDGNIVRLDTGIPTTLTLGNQARIVRLK
jgi:hypothetical protein